MSEFSLANSILKDSVGDKMKIWSTEHVFNHSWETVTQSQWRKYPNPHNPAVLGSDVVDRHVGDDGILHSRRIIISSWSFPTWVQRIIGTPSECHAYEYSTVDAVRRKMEMTAVNLTFCSVLSMRERMCYSPHPTQPDKTIMRQETEVSVRGVPLTDYIESSIISMCSLNSVKGRAAMDWVVEKLGSETRNVSANLEKLQTEVLSLTDKVADNLIWTAKKSIEDLQKKHSLQAAEELLKAQN